MVMVGVFIRPWGARPPVRPGESHQIQGDHRAARGLSFPGTVVECATGRWAVTAAALLPSWITGTFYFEVKKESLQGVRPPRLEEVYSACFVNTPQPTLMFRDLAKLATMMICV